MDPTARREAWDIIQRAKQNKIIILTTHYMDEAEQLADKVAIISNGSLQVCGSTLFLKKKYGSGFFIEAEFDKSSAANKDDLRTSLQQLTESVGLSQKIICHQHELGKAVYELPYEMSANFGPLFDMIDQNKSSLGIKDYSVRSSTLEEVFISLGEKEKLRGKDLKLQADGPGCDYTPQLQQNSFYRLFCSSFAFHFKSSLYSGYLCNIIIAALAFTFAGLSSHFALRTVDKPLDYTDMAGIYQSVLPMDVYYNEQVGPPFSSGSTQEFMSSLVSAAGQGTINLSPQTYPDKSDDQTWKEYYSAIAD